ncbi:MAG: zinc-ribbon and DUF3426 domain-containing protein [Acidovorax sp.]
MSQVTCCPACGTKFKVVADQLRISEGWVRCGQCKEIFDATQHLERAEQAPALPPEPAVPPPPPATFGIVFRRRDGEAQPAPKAEEQPLAQAPVADPADAPESASDAPSLDAAAAEDNAVAGYDEPDLPLESSLGVPPPVSSAAQLTEAQMAALPELQPEPGFVRAARRAAFWQRKGVRTGLAALGGLLALTLLVQVALHGHDRLAASSPALRPLVSAACAVFGCATGPRQDIAAVAIDASAFNKAARSDAYQLSFTLKNHAGTAVAMPALELTLTDAQEQPVLRRVLTPAELSAPAALPPQGEWSGSVAVALAGPALRLAGYRVLAFYP